MGMRSAVRQRARRGDLAREVGDRAHNRGDGELAPLEKKLGEGDKESVGRGFFSTLSKLT